MQIRYYKEYSRYLNRDMEFKEYGLDSLPALHFDFSLPERPLF